MALSAAWGWEHMGSCCGALQPWGGTKAVCRWWWVLPGVTHVAGAWGPICGRWVSKSMRQDVGLGFVRKGVAVGPQISVMRYREGFWRSTGHRG